VEFEQSYEEVAAILGKPSAEAARLAAHRKMMLLGTIMKLNTQASTHAGAATPRPITASFSADRRSGSAGLPARLRGRDERRAASELSQLLS
jgi:hypothetical protein